jgi:uncharacterized metal-binding protein (TIGR02443 family)
MAREKKRFIAGATCTECQAQDSLMLFTENGIEHVECVECGFKMSEPKAQGSGSEREFDGVIGVFKPD